MGKKKDNNYLVQGTILTAASIIARVIGMIYRIPLNRIIGPEGNSYYSTANEIYTILLLISSYNLPLAISKLISERLNNGEYKNAYRVYRCALKFAIPVGAIFAIVTFFGADFIATVLVHNEMAVYGIRILAPALFFVALLGVVRGFFQGHGNMVPTAVSQIIEQIVNAVVSVAGAAVLIGIGASVAESEKNPSFKPAYGAAGATIGTVVSVCVALVFLGVIYTSYIQRYKRKMRRDKTHRKESEQKIYRAIIITIVPVILSSVLYNITTILDQSVFNSVLASQGYTSEQYNIIWGTYSGEFRVLMNVPLALASCLAPSIVPSLAAAWADRDKKAARQKAGEAIRYTMVITIPCAVGMMALASPIMRMLFADDGSLVEGIMQGGSPMMVLFALSTLTTGILQGIGKMKVPLINTVVALVIHVIVLLVSLRVGNMNIYGVILANTVFAFAMCVLNAIAVKRYLHYRQEIPKTFIVPLLSSAVMGVVAWGVHALLEGLVGNIIATLFAIVVGACVYFIFLVRFRGVSQKELASFPKGSTLVSLSRKLHLI
ncbi:MAG: polysaccharide biosynthesis protein [Lachnospiraceae bacterium]|nr:polysaccharide biosynthesis protein [Robinsoniella sp.]MDY3765411.1 polysaccharide biosynthesis protein [Lachnospiraceae bacterium]